LATIATGAKSLIPSYVTLLSTGVTMCEDAPAINKV
jgi:hypothetical protein